MKLLPVALAALLLSSAVSAQTLTATHTANVVDRNNEGTTSDWYLTVNYWDAAPAWACSVRSDGRDEREFLC